MLIVNALVFTGDRFAAGLKVRLEAGRILEAGENTAPLPGEEILDLEGDRLLPGFVDVHIHGCMGQDTMRGEEDIRRMSRELYRMGVAAFCPTTMSASEEDTARTVAAVRRVMEQPEPEGARVIGAHMEAPFLQEHRAGAQKKEYFTDPDWDALLRMTGGKPETVRLITLAPERPGSEAFIRRAAAAGIHVSIGHTDADAETVHLAADWGADHATHLFNAQTPLHHRKPGVPGAALTDDRIYCEMICDGIHLHRDTVRLIHRCKGAGKAVAITDAMEAAGMPDGQYALGGQQVTVRNGEARLEDGTLAGSVLTMKQALENLAGLFGLDAADACAMCTRTPADSVGEPLLGRIVPGAPAPLNRWGTDGRWKGTVTA